MGGGGGAISPIRALGGPDYDELLRFVDRYTLKLMKHYDLSMVMEYLLRLECDEIF